MEKVTHYASNEHPFNSVLETGIRAVVILDALYPRQCDLVEMTWFDHLVVHTRDLDDNDAPNSLHPKLPNRTGELFVRRRLVEQSLYVMQRMHLVDVSETEDGVFYKASEDAPSYTDLLQSKYSSALKQRARWLANHFEGMDTPSIKEIVELRIGRWTAEFRVFQTSDHIR